MSEAVSSVSAALVPPVSISFVSIVPDFISPICSASKFTSSVAIGSVWASPAASESVLISSVAIGSASISPAVTLSSGIIAPHITAISRNTVIFCITFFFIKFSP